MYNNEKCCCMNNLEKDINLKLTFENEIFSVYGKLNSGENLILKYHGKLISEEDSGRKIFLNYGYGNLWKDKNVVEMHLCCHSEEKSYCAELEITNNDNLFFCFMDDSNNWDLDDNSSYMVAINEPITVLTKKIVDVVVQDEEYENSTAKFFKKITKTIMNFFLKIGEAFETAINE